MKHFFLSNLKSEIMKRYPILQQLPEYSKNILPLCIYIMRSGVELRLQFLALLSFVGVCKQAH